MARMRLLDQVRNEIRVRHYSLKTEKAYCYWIRFYIRFRDYCHPAELDGEQVRAFLTYLALKRRVSASTQNQALKAPGGCPRNALPTQVWGGLSE